LRYLSERTPIPKIERGYWPTLNIWWEYDPDTEPPTTVQFEVFDTKIEIYTFKDNGPGLAPSVTSIQMRNIERASRFLQR
jgi:hypothetical protein